MARESSSTLISTTSVPRWLSSQQQYVAPATDAARTLQSGRPARRATHLHADLSLAYALHVYKGQGITAETSGVLMGGWQTDRESAYVALSRAREQTQIYVSREDLGEVGMDLGAIERLGDRLRRSGAQQASVSIEVDRRRDRAIDQQRRLEHAKDLERGFVIE
jgi:ATP-dependent exoDNAse (exonuclease V) alpha subunit